MVFFSYLITHSFSSFRWKYTNKDQRTFTFPDISQMMKGGIKKYDRETNLKNILHNLFVINTEPIWS